jgi:hypothetical protein
MSVFDKTDTQYERGLQHTKVKAIVYKNETKAIINATYLNSVDSEKWDKKHQNFLIGIYIAEDNEKENTKFIKNYRYKVTLDGKEFSKYILLTKEYKIYKNIPLKNPWSKYYIMSFKKSENNNKTITLQYANPIFGKVILPFSKE